MALFGWVDSNSGVNSRFQHERPSPTALQSVRTIFPFLPFCAGVSMFRRFGRVFLGVSLLLLTVHGGAQEPKPLPMHVTVRGTWKETRKCTYEPRGVPCQHCQVEGRLIAGFDAEVAAGTGHVFSNPKPGRVHVEYLEREFCPKDGEGKRTTGKGNGPLISPMRLNRGPRYAEGEGALGAMVDLPAAGLAQPRNLLFKDFQPGPADMQAEAATVMASMKAPKPRYNRMVGLQAPFLTSESSNWQMVGLTMLVAVGPGKGGGSVAWEEQGAVNDEAWELRVVDVEGLRKGANWALQEGTEDDIHRTTRYEVSWSFVPVEDGEVTVEIEDYEDWIPEGNLGDPGKPGNTIQMKAKAHKTGHPEQPLDRKVNFTFTLAETSMEPGVCMNWPPKPGISDYGLKILQERNKTLEVIGPDEAKTRKSGLEAELTVSAVAYGAWTRLKVTAETEDGQKLKVRFHGKEVQDIPLPHFEGENHVALAYLKRHGLKGVSADWDKEQEPRGNGFAGDGLTLYEEYRGFAVKGKHVTGHPSKKDLFVCDETGQEASGIDLFERLTELVVHRVDLEELGTGRIVNRNFGQGPHSVAQHGLLIRRGTGSYEAIGIHGSDTPIGPPRTVRCINVPAPGKATSDDAKQERASLLAHELCHGVGVSHHGDGVMARLWFWKEEILGGWQLYEDQLAGDPDTPADMLRTAGKPVAIRALREADGSELKKGDPWPAGSAWDDRLKGCKVLIFGKQSECSGDAACTMRYADRQAWLLASNPAVRYIPDSAEKVPRDQLCTSPAGTGVNGPSHRPESRYGPAQAGRGNCKGQIVVSDLCQN